MYVFLSWIGGDETRVENGFRRDAHQELRMDSQFLLFFSSQATADSSCGFRDHGVVDLDNGLLEHNHNLSLYISTNY